MIVKMRVLLSHETLSAISGTTAAISTESFRYYIGPFADIALES